jgi:hypothetical protein
VYENASQFGQAPVVDAEPVEGFLESQQLPVHHLEGHGKCWLKVSSKVSLVFISIFISFQCSHEDAAPLVVPTLFQRQHSQTGK